MKKLSFIFITLSAILLPLKGETLQQLEKRLQMSSPGLPEFRVYNDVFGVTRSVRTLPGKKKQRCFQVVIA